MIQLTARKNTSANVLSINTPGLSSFLFCWDSKHQRPAGKSSYTLVVPTTVLTISTQGDPPSSPDYQALPSARKLAPGTHLPTLCLEMTVAPRAFKLGVRPGGLPPERRPEESAPYPRHKGIPSGTRPAAALGPPGLRGERSRAATYLKLPAALSRSGAESAREARAHGAASSRPSDRPGRSGARPPAPAPARAATRLSHPALHVIRVPLRRAGHAGKAGLRPTPWAARRRVSLFLPDTPPRPTQDALTAAQPR